MSHVWDSRNNMIKGEGVNKAKGTFFFSEKSERGKRVTGNFSRSVM